VVDRKRKKIVLIEREKETSIDDDIKERTRTELTGRDETRSELFYTT